jgi:hypothetical protein
MIFKFTGRLEATLSSYVRISFNEEPAMRNQIIDGATGSETKRRHFSSVDVVPSYKEKLEKLTEFHYY